jgi:glycosyltransferase involved in cell wall biosynthesis
MKKNIIVYCILSLKDPLIEGLILDYLKSVSLVDNSCIFHLLTEESDIYKQQKTNQEIQNELQNYNIKWYPITYRKGKLLLLWKLIAGLTRLYQIALIKIKYNPKLIIGYLSVAGDFAVIFSKIFNLQFLSFCFEPHSLYMLDFNTWTKKSFKYKIMSFFEKMQVKEADYLTVPTIHTKELSISWNTKAKKIVDLPISIDTESIFFKEEERNKLRKKYAIPDHKKVVLYLGKFNGIYYNEKEVALFYKQLADLDNNFYPFIITPDDIKTINQHYSSLFPNNQYTIIGKIPYDEISSYISMADIGLVAVPPLPSQKYRTPVKTANYLACGIPVITNKISDEDDWILENKIGIVLEDFTLNKKIIDELNALLIDVDSLRVRCREKVIERRGKQNTIKVLTEIFNEVFQ